jgi:tripartite-type tricarboxylate transporter receptor subunit TctC
VESDRAARAFLFSVAVARGCAAWRTRKPRATPPALVLQLNRELVRILNMPTMKERLATLGAEPMANTPEAFANFVRSEMSKYERIVRASGANAD